MCKTSHQAISHRCKSVAMSTWTMEEVRSLTGQQGGGNEAALHSWLGNAPGIGKSYRGGARPKQGDKIDIFKQFIQDCYEKEMFKSATPYEYNEGNHRKAESHTNSGAPQIRHSPAPIASPAPATVDFFSSDFQDQSFFAPPQPPLPSIAIPTGFSAPAVDSPWSTQMKNDPFAGFTSSPVSVPTPTASNDFFASTNAFSAGFTPPLVSNGSSSSTSSNSNVDIFSTFSAPSPVTASPVVSTVDPFGSSTVLLPTNSSVPPASSNRSTSIGSIATNPSARPSGMAPSSGLAISSLMDPLASRGAPGAPMGYRPGVMAPQQPDNFDFVRDSMGGSKPRPTMTPSGNISGMGMPDTSYGANVLPMMARNVTYPPMGIPQMGGHGTGGGMGMPMGGGYPGAGVPPGAMPMGGAGTGAYPMGGGGVGGGYHMGGGGVGGAGIMGLSKPDPFAGISGTPTMNGGNYSAQQPYRR